MDHLQRRNFLWHSNVKCIPLLAVLHIYLQTERNFYKNQSILLTIEHS